MCRARRNDTCTASAERDGQASPERLSHSPQRLNFIISKKSKNRFAKRLSGCPCPRRWKFLTRPQKKPKKWRVHAMRNAEEMTPLLKEHFTRKRENNG